MAAIDKGIPIPEATRGRGPAPKYPWRSMEVGDSFLMDIGARSIEKAHKSSLEQLRRYAPLKFICRVVVENGERVVRVWRTA